MPIASTTCGGLIAVGGEARDRLWRQVMDAPRQSRAGLRAEAHATRLLKARRHAPASAALLVHQHGQLHHVLPPERHELRLGALRPAESQGTAQGARRVWWSADGWWPFERGAQAGLDANANSQSHGACIRCRHASGPSWAKRSATHPRSSSPAVSTPGPPSGPPLSIAAVGGDVVLCATDSWLPAPESAGPGLGAAAPRAAPRREGPPTTPSVPRSNVCLSAYSWSSNLSIMAWQCGEVRSSPASSAASSCSTVSRDRSKVLSSSIWACRLWARGALTGCVRW